MKFSDRIQSIDSSGIRRVFDLAAKLDNPINLSIGQPDFDAAAEIKSSAIAAIESGRNSYTQTQGIFELREKVAQKYGVTLGGDLDVTITSGVSGGILLSYFALLDPGDEILVPDPYFCMYPDLASLVNAKAVMFDTYPDFSIDVAKIEPLVTNKTKAIVINSPANPTGAVISEQELSDVISFAKERDLWLIYDEIYEAYCYDSKHLSALGRYDKAIILNGFSKSHGITGWRVGFVIAPTELVQQMNKAQQYTFVCSPSIAQCAMVDGLDLNLEGITRNYRDKRDYLCNNLSSAFDYPTPGGAFYLFSKIPKGFSSGQEFVEKAIANNLLIVPGNVFSRQDTHFRISFAAEKSILERGVEILNSIA